MTVPALPRRRGYRVNFEGSWPVYAKTWVPIPLQLRMRSRGFPVPPLELDQRDRLVGDDAFSVLENDGYALPFASGAALVDGLEGLSCDAEVFRPAATEVPRPARDDPAEGGRCRGRQRVLQAVSLACRSGRCSRRWSRPPARLGMAQQVVIFARGGDTLARSGRFRIAPGPFTAFQSGVHRLPSLCAAIGRIGVRRVVIDSGANPESP